MTTTSLESIRHIKSSLVVHNNQSSLSHPKRDQEVTSQTCILDEIATVETSQHNRQFYFVLQPGRKRMEVKAPLSKPFDSPTSHSSVTGTHSFLQRTKPKRDLTSFVKKRLEYPKEDSEILGNRRVEDWNRYLTKFQYHPTVYEQQDVSLSHTIPLQKQSKRRPTRLFYSWKQLAYFISSITTFPNEEESWTTSTVPLLVSIFGQ